MRYKNTPTVRDKDFPTMVYRDCKQGEVSDVVRKRVVYEIADNKEELELLIKEGYRMEVDAPVVKLKPKVVKKVSKKVASK